MVGLLHTIFQKIASSSHAVVSRNCKQRRTRLLARQICFLVLRIRVQDLGFRA